MAEDKNLKLIYILLTLIGISALIYAGIKLMKPLTSKAPSANTSCVTHVLAKSMSDNLMAGVIDKGKPFEVHSNFYSCNPIKVNDIVWHRVSNGIEPVARIVVAVPGDRFRLYNDKSDKKRWYIQVNNSDVEFDKRKYTILSNSIPPLKTYEQQLAGQLPKDK